MSILISILLSLSLGTPFDIVEHPNGSHDGSVLCVDCNHWYIPNSLTDIRCYCHE